MVGSSLVSLAERPAATDRKFRVEAKVCRAEKHEFTGSEAQDREMIPGQKRKPSNRAKSESKGKKPAGKRGKSGR